MVKVVYLISTFRKSGPVMVLLNIIKNLDRNQIVPVIITLSPEPGNSMVAEFNELGIQIENLNLSRIQGVFRARKELDRLLQTIHPEIIHSHGFRSDALSAKMKTRALKVSTLHNNPFVDYPMKFGFLRGRYMAAQSKKSIQRLDLPIACSKSIQYQLGLLGIHPECIQNGIDIEQFQPLSETEKVELRKRLDLAPDKMILISTGSLIKRKNLKTVLQGLELTKRKDILLLIVGDGPERKNLEKRYGEDERIRFVGFQDNVKDFLNSADSIISASLSEGLPNGVIEAMACGIHCILSDIPSHRELSLPVGNRFFPTVDSVGISEIIERLTWDEAHKVGKQNRKIAQQLFSSENMAVEYQKFYVRNGQ